MKKKREARTAHMDEWLQKTHKTSVANKLRTDAEKSQEEWRAKIDQMKLKKQVVLFYLKMISN